MWLRSWEHKKGNIMDMTTIVGILAAMLAVSEGLALIPGLKSNSVFQIIYFVLKAVTNGIKTKEV